MTPLDRFVTKLDVHDCWSWTASLTDGGYGQFFPGDGRRWRAHRWLWTELVGPIPKGRELDHLCRNRRCVNPDHLEPVTRRVNQFRGYSPTGVNARKIACANGHTFDDTNTRIGWGGKKQCRVCDRTRKKLTYYRAED